MTASTAVPPLQPSLAGVDWKCVRQHAFIAARGCVRDEDLDEVVNEGIRRVLDGSAPWDDASGVELPKHIAKVGIAALRVASRARERRGAKVLGPTVADMMGPPPSSPEVIAARNEAGERVFAELLGHFAGDTAALALLACYMGSITEAADQAAHTGLDIEVVWNIRKRVNRRVEALQEGAAR